MSTEDKKTDKKEKLSGVQIFVIERMLQREATVSLGTGSMRDKHGDFIMWVNRGTINALKERNLFVLTDNKSLILNPKWDFTALQPK